MSSQTECPSNHFMVFIPFILPQLSQCNNSEIVFIHTVKASRLRVLLSKTVLSPFLPGIAHKPWTSAKVNWSSARWLMRRQESRHHVSSRKSPLSRQLPVGIQGHFMCLTFYRWIWCSVFTLEPGWWEVIFLKSKWANRHLNAFLPSMTYAVLVPTISHKEGIGRNGWTLIVKQFLKASISECLLLTCILAERDFMVCDLS